MNLFENETQTFLEFARIRKSHEGVIAFADRYGFLFDCPFEDIDLWYDSIRAMRKAVDAWERARATHDYSKVAKLIDLRVGRRLFAGSNKRGIPVFLLLNNDNSQGSVQLDIRPGTLIDALWLQLALAIAGEHNFRACSVCGAWYRTEAGGGRPDKIYCSDACRMKAYRERKKGR